MTGRRGNLRDLGGLPTASGRSVRPGVLLRSEAPATLNAADRRRLDGVALVFDLRASGEADDALEVWGASGGPEVVNVPLLGHERMYAPDLLVSISTDADFARRYMEEIYLEFLDALRKEFLGEFAERIGDRHQVPVLVHCTGGQDRTGVAVAAILLALDVPRDVVVADYAKTMESFDLERLIEVMQALIGPGAQATEDAVQYLMARPEYMDAAIDRLLSDHESIEACWAAAGADDAALDRLRAVLLE